MGSRLRDTIHLLQLFTTGAFGSVVVIGREPRPRTGASPLASDDSGRSYQLARLCMASPLQPAGSTANRVRIVVATSVMLTFISYWRAAAIVLNDLGSSAFYAAGIAEQAVGKSAPWFILGVMLFSFAVRAVYVESCSMFVRGGVYRVVKEALGGTLGQDQRLRPDVRLHPHRPHLRRFRRAIHRGTDQ